MSRYIVLRLFDNFFRRWWLFLLPLLILGGVGVASAASTKDEYRSAGSINVPAGTLITELSSVGNVNYGFQTPAEVTSSQIGQLLSTGLFIKSIAEAAGVSGALDSGVLTIEQIRSSISIGVAGNNVVTVAATSDNPEVAFRLAQATIDTFKQTQIDTAVSDSDAAAEFYNSQLGTYQAALDQAQQALDAYIEDNPTQLDGSYSAKDQIAIEGLTAAKDAAQTRFNDTQSKLDDANLAKAQATTAVNQRLQVIDVPEMPTAREPKLKNMATTFATFFVLGLLLMLAGLVVVTALDRSIRFPTDVEARLGIPPIAAVPRVRR